MQLSTVLILSMSVYLVCILGHNMLAAEEANLRKSIMTDGSEKKGSMHDKPDEHESHHGGGGHADEDGDEDEHGEHSGEHEHGGGHGHGERREIADRVRRCSHAAHGTTKRH